MNSSPESFAPGSQAYSDAEAKLSRAFERTSRFLNDGKIDQDTFDRKREDALQNYNNEIERLKQAHADSLAAEKQAKADLFSIFRDVAEQKAAEEATASGPTDSAPRQAVDERGVLTEDYLKSEQGQDALDEESRLYQRAEEIDRAVSDGKIDLETAKQLKDNLLEDSVERIDSIRERYEKLGTASMQAAQAGPTVNPDLSSTNTNLNHDAQTVSQVNPNNQASTDAQANVTAEDDKLNRMIGKMDQQLSDGKAEGLTSDVIKNLRANMGIRLENNMRKQPQQTNDQARQTNIDQATQNSADQAGNQSPITLSPEQKMNDFAREFARWRNEGYISDSQYDNLIEVNKAIFRAQQKSADAAAQAAAERARQDAKDKADQQAKNKADQDAKDRAAQQVYDHDANNVGDQSQDQDKDRVSRIERFKEEFKNLSGPQKFMTIVSAAMMPIILAGTVFGGIINAVISNQSSGDTGTGTPAAAASANSDSTAFEDIVSDAMAQANSALMAAKYDAAHSGGEVQEAHGIQDGYYKPGRFMDKNKGNPSDFANAATVATQIRAEKGLSDKTGDDECEVLSAVAHDEVEALADQLAGYPDEVKAKFGIPQEFMGLSLTDTEAKLQSLDPTAYDNILAINDAILDAAFTRDATLNGPHQNAGMELNGETATHDTVRAVACVTEENGTKARELYWTIDGNANSSEIGSVLTKITMDETNHRITGGCTQFVKAYMANDHTYVDLKIIQQNPDGTTTVITSTPESNTPDDNTPSDDKPNKPSTPDKPSDDTPNNTPDKDKPKPDKDKPKNDKPTGDEPDDDEPNGDEPSDDEPSGDEPDDDEPSGDEPSDDTPDEPDKPDRGKGDNTHAGDNQEQMGETENTKGDPEREATESNNASNANPGDQVTNNTIEEEHGAPEAAPGSEAIADNQGVTVDGEPLTDPTSGEQVVREGEGGEATNQEIADAAEGVASTFDPVETNVDHSDAVVADNANTVQQPTVTDTGVGAGQNADRSQADLTNIVNGGGK